MEKSLGGIGVDPVANAGILIKIETCVARCEWRAIRHRPIFQLFDYFLNALNCCRVNAKRFRRLVNGEFQKPQELI